MITWSFMNTKGQGHWLTLVQGHSDSTFYFSLETLSRLKPNFIYILHGMRERKFVQMVGWLCWGLTSQSTIFQSCRDGAIASWVINQYFRGVKCLAQGHNTAAVGLEPRTSRSGVRHSTTEPPRSPCSNGPGHMTSMATMPIYGKTP